jgi:hypothetical protein
MAPSRVAVLAQSWHGLRVRAHPCLVHLSVDPNSHGSRRVLVVGVVAQGTILGGGPLGPVGSQRPYEAERQSGPSVPNHLALTMPIRLTFSTI